MHNINASSFVVRYIVTNTFIVQTFSKNGLLSLVSHTFIKSSNSLPCGMCLCVAPFLVKCDDDAFTESPINGKHYKVLTDAAPYDDQKRICSDYGPDYHLATIQSVADALAVPRVLNGKIIRCLFVTCIYFEITSFFSAASVTQKYLASSISVCLTT